MGDVQGRDVNLPEAIEVNGTSSPHCGYHLRAEKPFDSSSKVG